MGRTSIVPALEAKLGQPLKTWLVSRIHEGKSPEEIAKLLEIGKSKAYEIINDFGLKETLKAIKREEKTGGGELRKYLEDYLAEKTRAGLSSESIGSDRSLWKSYIWWLEFTGKPTTVASLISLDVTRQFFDYLTTQKDRFGHKSDKPIADETQRTYRKRMAAFIHWLQKMEIIPDDRKSNPFNKMMQVKNRSHLAEDMPDEIIDKMLKTFGDSFEDIRNKAIIEWFLETGMRLGGVSNLMLSQFDWEKGVGRITEKGEKQRTIVLSDKLKTQVAKWLAIREPKAKTGHMWIGNDGAPLTDSGIYNMIHKLNELDGVKEDIARLPGHPRFHPHLFRHLWAKHLALSEVPALAMMIMGGWSDLSLVQHYAAAYSQEKAWSYINKASPLNNMG